MPSLNVLVTAGSRRVPLVQGFSRALRQAGVAGKVIVTDVNPFSPAVHVSDRAYRVPLSSDPGYVEEITAIAIAEGVGLIVPTIDDELPTFARAKARLERHGIRVAVSTLESTEICNDKLRTSAFLLDHGIPAARAYPPHALPDPCVFPLFVKPRFGRGSVGAFAARNAPELAFFLGYVSDPIVQDYLDGPEFTIDLLCDFDGRPLSVVPRERIVIRSGVSDRGRTVRNPQLMALGLACARAFLFVGPVNIQCRLVAGRPVIFEINPRFSGGIPLTIAAGADFPRMLVDLALGRPVTPSIGAFQDDLWMTNFEASVFVAGSEQTRLAEPPARVEDVA